MPDSPLTDAEVLDEAPRQFAKLLQSVAQGHVLWHPTCLPHGQHMIGDCGFVDGGEFTRLYNVFDDQHPPGVDPLPRLDGDIEILRETNVKNTLQSRSIHEMDFSPNADLSAVVFIPPSSLKIRTALQREKEDVAFLTLYGPMRVVAKYRQTRKLENYLAVHAAKIVEYYKDNYPVKAHYLMIVYRTTAAASWFGGYTSSKRLEIGAEVSVYGAGGEVRLAHARSSAWSITHGEPSWDNESPPEHCVILRAVRCRWRDQLRNRARAFVKPLTNVFRSSSSRTPSEPGASRDSQRGGQQGPSETATSSSQGTALMDSEIDSDFDNDDLLDAVLDVVLVSHQDIDCVVGNWDTIVEFLEKYGQFPDDWKAGHLIVPSIEKRHSQAGAIAHLLAIHPRVNTLTPGPEDLPMSIEHEAKDKQDHPSWSTKGHPTPRPIHTALPEDFQFSMMGHPAQLRSILPHPAQPYRKTVQFTEPEPQPISMASQAYPTPPGQMRNYIPAGVPPELGVGPRFGIVFGSESELWFVDVYLEYGLWKKLRSIIKYAPRLWTDINNSVDIPFDKLFPYLSGLKAAPRDEEVSNFADFLQAHYEKHRPRIEALKEAKKIEYQYLQDIYQPGAQVIVRDASSGMSGAAAVVVSSEFLGYHGHKGFQVQYKMIGGTTRELHWITGLVTITPFEAEISRETLDPSPVSVDELAWRIDSGHKFLNFMENGGVHHVKISGSMYPDAPASSAYFAHGQGMIDPGHGTLRAQDDPSGLAGFDRTPIERTSLPEDIHWLLPTRVHCYSFIYHIWGMVNVADVEPVSNDKTALDRLVLDNKELINAALSTPSSILPCPTILLHGPAGVGKTFTAEMLAEGLGRPLYRPTTFYNDYGPITWSMNQLSFMLSAAERWNAILLLDDVDADDAQRATRMEFIEHLLRGDARRKLPVILIARRVAALPPSILERITFAFEYTTPDFDARTRMWRRFAEEALQHAERKIELPLDEGALHELAKWPFTPLAIKEVIQTALALADSQGETLALDHFLEVADRKAQSLKDTDVARREVPLPLAPDDAMARTSSFGNWLRFIAQGFA